MSGVQDSRDWFYAYSADVENSKASIWVSPTYRKSQGQTIPSSVHHYSALHIHIYIYIQIHMYMCVYTCIYIYIYIYICIYTYTYVINVGGAEFRRAPRHLLLSSPPPSAPLGPQMAICVYVMLCYVMSCYAIFCHAMPYHVMLGCAMLCYATLGYAMLCYAMSWYVYAMLCYIMLCYVMLWCVMSTPGRGCQGLAPRAPPCGPVFRSVLLSSVGKRGAAAARGEPLV